MRRGPYKQYLVSNCRVPESTQRYRNKIRQCIANPHDNDHLQSSLPTINEYDQDSSDEDNDNLEQLIPVISSTITNDSSYKQATTEECSNIIFIAAFVLRHNLTNCCTEDLLRLINSLNIEQLPVPTSKYLFLKNTRSTTNSWMKKFYCPQCMNDVRSENEMKICTSCGEVMSSFFIHIPLIPQLIDLLQTPGILVEIEKTKTTQINKPYYSDIISGTYYRHLMENGIIKREDLTLLLNTDGVSPCLSASKSIWPLQIILNELPYRLRRRNVLLCGLWFGKKPSFNIFAQFLIEELKVLSEKGFVINCEKSSVTLKAFLLGCATDSVARPLIQRINQFNGFCGCTYCLSPGTILPGSVNTRVYLGAEVGRSRTHEQHLRDAAKSLESNRIFNGVKGPCFLSSIITFDESKCFTFDYMHTILLGVVRMLVDCWLESENHTQPYYLGNRINQLDEVLLNIKPPKEITRVPRSLTARSKWKAAEWRNFLLYYSYSVLIDVMPTVYFVHWCKLVYSIYIFLKPSISHQEFDTASIILKEFVHEIEQYYGPKYCRFNVHMLLHIPKNVERFGALWGTSLFPFEHYNGVLNNFFSNSTGVLQQISDRYLRFRYIEKLLYALPAEVYGDNQDVADDIENPHKQKLLKKLLNDYKIYPDVISSCYVSSPSYADQSFPINLRTKLLIEEVLHVEIVNLGTVHRYGYFNSILCHGYSTSRMEKRFSSAVFLTDGKFVIIKHIFTVNTLPIAESLTTTNHVVLECEHLLVSKRPCAGDFKVRSPMNKLYTVVKRSNCIIISTPSMIAQKCILTQPKHFDIDTFIAIPLVNNFEKD